MKIKSMIIGGLLAFAASVSTAQAVVYTYVGKWAVADGPLWSGPLLPGINPSLSGRETAALLFGGTFSNYAISTLGNDPNTVNFKTFLDGYADIQYLTNAQSQDFVGNVGGTYASGFGNYSAYVFDHACGIHYCDNGGGDRAINYAFLASGVPEPSTWAMMLIGFAGLGYATRRKRLAVAVA
jgi:hypothetical protein